MKYFLTLTKILKTNLNTEKLENGDEENQSCKKENSKIKLKKKCIQKRQKFQVMTAMAASFGNRTNFIPRNNTEITEGRQTELTHMVQI